MMQHETEKAVEAQREFFLSGSTKELTFRTEQLKLLKAALKNNENALCDAIKEDFGKSPFETLSTELGFLSMDIDDHLKNMARWSRRKKVRTNLINFPSSSYILPEPLGTSLIIGAWNYPIQLSLSPLVAAISAGNTAIVKPSEMTPNTSAALFKMISSTFPSEYIKVVEGGVDVTTDLLAQKFDKVFFTGSTRVGRIVYRAAAKHLCPVTLELGGKSPAIFAPDANLVKGVKRLVWGKFLNSGQTCIAPDYVLVHSSIHDHFVEALINVIKVNDYRAENDNFVQIINQANFERLKKLILPEKVVYGGETDAEERMIFPTVMTAVQPDDAVMREEIFGPILPVIKYDHLDEAVQMIRSKPRPLALYLFTSDRKTISRVESELSFGGGAINDVIMHITNPALPFGGVGKSGLGSYHGEAGFKTFSHYKSILKKPFWFEPNFKYPPYTDKKLKWMKWALGWK